MLQTKIIKLNKKENLSEILISGFSEPEEVGVWATGTESIIRLPISGMSGRIRFSMKLSPHLDEKVLPTQSLQISSSLNVLYDAMIGFDQIVECELPEIDVEGKEFLNLTLTHVDAASPYEIGKSNDRRLLAFKLFCIELSLIDYIYSENYSSILHQRDEEDSSQIVTQTNSKILLHPTAPILAGKIRLKFHYSNYLNVIGSSGRHEISHIFPALMAPAQIPTRINFNNCQAVRNRRLVLREHLTYPSPVPVSVYSIAGGILWGEGLITYDNRFVFPHDCFPKYLLNLVQESAHQFSISILDNKKWDRRRVTKIEMPVTSPIHPNLVYGHFLLEMLPRFYVASLLLAMGLKFKVALPKHLPNWVMFFVDLFFSERELLIFDKELEVIEAPSIIITSMLHNDYNFHPAFNLMIEDIYRRIDVMTVQKGLEPKKFSSKLYISRSKYTANKRLLNESEVEAAMAAIGFEIVHPQEMSLLDQISMFRGASYVAGEYTSAIHGTMFSGFGTRVLCIDYHSLYQSSIGRIRQQPHCFITPEDGNFRHWRQYKGEDRTFSVDIPTLIEMATSMLKDEEMNDI